LLSYAKGISYGILRPLEYHLTTVVVFLFTPHSASDALSYVYMHISLIQGGVWWKLCCIYRYSSGTNTRIQTRTSYCTQMLAI